MRSGPDAAFFKGTLDKLKMKPQAVAEYRVFLDEAKGGLPDQEFQARQRIRIIELELKKK